MNKLAFLSLLALSSISHSAAAAEDLRILSCTVDFKLNNGLTSTRTQELSWLLPVDKGSVQLKSLGNVKIVLSKRLVAGEPEYKMVITEGKALRGEIRAGHHSFEYSVPVSVKVDDGEDGFRLNQLKVTCDPGYAVG